MSAAQSIVGFGRVLLVEDDEAACQLFATALRLTGYYVRTAADGLRGLRALETFDPDVIVLDLGLPIASGFEVLHELRGSGRTKRTPVIAISGHAHGLRLAKKNPEFCATLPKPFDPETLVQMVSRMLRRRFVAT